MKPFNQSESAYTATAKTVVFSGSSNYDTDLLDNPVRKKVNAGTVAANVRAYQNMAGVL